MKLNSICTATAGSQGLQNYRNKIAALLSDNALSVMIPFFMGVCEASLTWLQDSQNFTTRQCSALRFCVWFGSKIVAYAPRPIKANFEQECCNQAANRIDIWLANRSAAKLWQLLDLKVNISRQTCASQLLFFQMGTVSITSLNYCLFIRSDRCHFGLQAHMWQKSEASNQQALH